MIIIKNALFMKMNQVVHCFGAKSRGLRHHHHRLG